MGDSSAMKMRSIPPKARFVIIATVVALLVVLLGSTAGVYLVLDNPGQGDAIVVLGGDQNDYRYYRALQMLKDNNNQLLFVDSSTDLVMFGRTLAAQEEEFIRRSAGALIDRVRICPIQGDSTVEEAEYVQRCLKGQALNSVILVTSDFHTRRALSIFRRRLPQYHWSAAAARDQSTFGVYWWRQREWAKTTLQEWAKTIWWETIDRWRYATISTRFQSKRAFLLVLSAADSLCFVPCVPR
jgi:uncharacterized SAM-binding protein YcdF (DUF218 family)